QELGRVVTHLFEFREGRKDKTAALHPFRRLKLCVRLLDHGGIQRALLFGQGAVDFHLQLLRQVGDNGFVRLEPAQDEGSGQSLQPRGRLRVAVDLNGNKEGALELRLCSEKAGVEKLENRPQVADVVLDRGTSKGSTVVRGKRAGGPRLFGLRILDVLGFV